MLALPGNRDAGSSARYVPESKEDEMGPSLLASVQKGGQTQCSVLQQSRLQESLDEAQGNQKIHLRPTTHSPRLNAALKPKIVLFSH